MDTKEAVTALAALAQETRLSIFRLLIEAGPEGLPAGRIGEAVDVPSATLSFHLKELHRAGSRLLNLLKGNGPDSPGRFALRPMTYDEVVRPAGSVLTDR